MDILRKWIRVSRFNFIPASLLPYAAGSVSAARWGFFDVPIFLLGLFGTALVHLAANLFNEYWDHRFRADPPNGAYRPHFGGSKAIQTGLIRAVSVRRAAWICLSAALLTGLALALILEAPIIMLLVLGGTFIAWAYTAPPFSFAYRGMGELALLIAFGPLLVTGGYLLQSAPVTAAILLLAQVPGFLIAAVLIANEFADAATDTRAGKRNLTVRLGFKRAARIYRGCLVCSFLLPAAAVAAGFYPPVLLVVFFSLPASAAAERKLAAAVRSGGGFNASSAWIMRFYLLFHFLLIAALILS